MTDRIAPHGLSQLVTGQQPQQSDIATIKGNVELMIDRGAPEQDIDAYLVSEGVTAEQLRQRSADVEQRGNGVSFLQGATFGFGDEIVGGGVAGLRTIYDPKNGEWFSGDYGKKYDEELAGERQLLTDMRAAHPYMSAGLEASGGVASSLIPAGAVMQGANMLGRTRQAAQTGLALGGLYGFGSGEGGFEQREANAVPNALWGGLGGAAGPMVGAGIGAAWNAVATKLAQRGIDGQSVQKILGELQATGWTPQQATQRLQELGPEGMLADVNPGMQEFLGATAISDTGAANVASTRLGQRLGGAPQRVSQDLDAAFGPPRDPYTQMQSNRAQRGTIGPQYEAAIQNAPPIPQGMGAQIGARLSNPRYTAAERATVQHWLGQIEDAFGSAGPMRPEDVAGRLQRVRFALDSEIEADQIRRFGYSSKEKANQGILSEIRSAVDDVLKNEVPGYRQADEAFAPVARQQAAYEKGRTRVLTNNVSAAEDAADVAGYTPRELDMSNAGIRYDLETRLSNQRNNPGIAADRLLSQYNNGQKVANRLGPQRADNLRRGIDREETFLQTSNLGDVRRGSRTAPLRQTAERLWSNRGGWRETLGNIVGGSAAGAAVGGMPGALAGGVGAAVTTARHRLARALTGENLELIRNTAERLTSQGPERDTLMRALESAFAALPGRSRNARNVERLAIALVLGGSPQAGSAAASQPATGRLQRALGFGGQ